MKNLDLPIHRITLPIPIVADGMQTVQSSLQQLTVVVHKKLDWLSGYSSLDTGLLNCHVYHRKAVRGDRVIRNESSSIV